jgi:mycothiol system anti-sigma-R factor
VSPSTGPAGPCDGPYDGPYDNDCTEVLERVFFFIDNELPHADAAQIQHHLDECRPCLRKYDLERTVKALVQRSCAERAPEGLRDKVLLRIRQVQVEISDSGVTSEVTSVTEVVERSER